MILKRKIAKARNLYQNKVRREAPKTSEKSECSFSTKLKTPEDLATQTINISSLWGEKTSSRITHVPFVASFYQISLFLTLNWQCLRLNSNLKNSESILRKEEILLKVLTNSDHFWSLPPRITQNWSHLNKLSKVWLRALSNISLLIGCLLVSWSTKWSIWSTGIVSWREWETLDSWT